MPRPLAFAPSELDELGEVFEDAWLTLPLADGDESMVGPAVRRALAQSLMEAAERGEIDPQRLKEHALTRFCDPTASSSPTFAWGVRGYARLLVPAVVTGSMGNCHAV